MSQQTRTRGPNVVPFGKPVGRQRKLRQYDERLAEKIVRSLSHSSLRFASECRRCSRQRLRRIGKTALNIVTQLYRSLQQVPRERQHGIAKLLQMKWCLIDGLHHRSEVGKGGERCTNCYCAVPQCDQIREPVIEVVAKRCNGRLEISDRWR